MIQLFIILSLITQILSQMQIGRFETGTFIFVEIR